MSSFYPLIPRMTSNTTPSGIATCSSALNSNYAVYKAFDKTANVWASVYNTSTVNQQWIKYEFPNVVKVKKIKLTVNNDRYLHYIIKGSLTDSDYIELWDYNQTGAVSDQSHVYELANEVSIKYLKLQVVTFQDKTGNPPQVNELQVYSEVNPNIIFERNPLSFVVSDDVSLTANFERAASLRYKVNGVWKYAIPYIKLNGNWYKAIAYRKTNGVWKQGI